MKRSYYMERLKKNYKWFVGIDVSKNELDFAVMQDSSLLLHTEITNAKDNIATFLRTLKEKVPGFRVASTLFCMEAIGFYAAALKKRLHTLKANLAV
ncbi:MAG TPA: hypothetical protein VHS53_07045, partial [Mucilaginibacter sp.]|nr:hypothetical protein [Mucilaginibacter sp.]